MTLTHLLVAHAVIGILVGAVLADALRTEPKDRRTPWPAIIAWAALWLPLLVVAMVAVTADAVNDAWRDRR
jgi:multisubunit Na+/H+ antiporter MnhE subunit